MQRNKPDESATLAELLAAFSLATNLGLRQSVEHVLLSWPIPNAPGCWAHRVFDPEVKRRDAPLAQMCRPTASPHVRQRRGETGVDAALTVCQGSAGLPTFCRHAGQGHDR